MTEQEIRDIDAYCAEYSVSKDERLKELCINRNQFYYFRRKYNLGTTSDLSANNPADISGSFIPVKFPGFSPPKPTRSSRKKDYEMAQGNTLTIEMRTPSGTELRIQGQINIKMLREIIQSSSTGGTDV